MQITVQTAQTVTLDSVVIEFVRDIFHEQKIVSKIKNVPRPIVLWSGAEQYAAAGNWTNETATAQASAVLALSSIPWAF
jgi:hypothetical protein